MDLEGTDSSSVELVGAFRCKRARVPGFTPYIALMASVLLCAAEGHAQTTSTTTITLDQNSITRNNYRTDRSRVWWVSYQDCRDNDVFSFPLTLTNISYTIEVWAGNEDCVGRRGNTDRGQCRLLKTQVPNDNTLRVEVPVRNIVGQVPNTLDVPDGGFPIDVCEESTDPAGAKFTFYFLQTSAGLSVGSTTWDGGMGGTGYDMVGPAAPGDISIGMGESQLSVKVEDVNEDPDRTSFAAYCVDLNDAAAEDPDFVPAEGSEPSCSTSALVPGVRPPVDLLCGEASETSDVITTNPNLVNDHKYALGVSAQDTLGNSGPLSELQCGTPKNLQDFFELYGEAGGPGGGGFCSVNLPGSSRSVGAPIAAFGALLSAFAVRRRRNRP